MGLSSGIITIPFTFEANSGDVQTAVGNGSDDLETVIKNGNIKPWAKYKPVRYSDWNTDGQLASDNTWKSSADWWRGGDGKCGLDISVFSDLGSPSNTSTFLGKLKEGQLSWGYNRPRGGNYNEPYRVLDFNCYNSNADSPIGGVEDRDVWLDSNNRFQLDYDISVGQYCLSLTDIRISGTSLQQYYLGLLLWSGNRWFCLTSINRLGGDSASVIIENASGLEGTWHVIPFFSSVKYAIGDSYGTGSYLSASITQTATITIHKSGTLYQVITTAYWSASNKITFEVTCYNLGSGSHTFSNIKVYIRTTTSPSGNPASGTTVLEVSMGSVTVSGNDDVTLAQRTVTVSRDSSLTYWVLSKADGTADYYNQIDDDPDIMPDV